MIGDSAVCAKSIARRTKRKDVCRTFGLGVSVAFARLGLSSFSSSQRSRSSTDAFHKPYFALRCSRWVYRAVMPKPAARLRQHLGFCKSPLPDRWYPSTEDVLGVSSGRAKCCLTIRMPGAASTARGSSGSLDLTEESLGSWAENLVWNRSVAQTYPPLSLGTP